MYVRRLINFTKYNKKIISLTFHVFHNYYLMQYCINSSLAATHWKEIDAVNKAKSYFLNTQINVLIKHCQAWILKRFATKEDTAEKMKIANSTEEI